MIEVEVKLPLFRRSITERALAQCGFVAGDLIQESDIYYTSDFRDFMARDEALRIRQSDNLTKITSRSILTFKGPKMDQVSMTRKELETVVESPEECRAILVSLGYKPLFPVNKLRQYYHKDNITACVDQVSELGSFLELEILVEDESMREDALKKIEDILSDLDLSLKESTTRSYLCMLQRKAGIQVD
ncbi:MAG: class IV adenylate cyclase [Eubacteriales bacterium]|nr:class IV adenylate cyclase [Eubacteriales bacterium]